MSGGPGGLRFRPLTEADARTIVGWRYDGPWAAYDAGPDDLAEILAGLARSVAAVDAGGALVGFFVFGAGARVSGGRLAGLYPPTALDVGLGLRPDLVGRGMGAGFVAAGLAWARRHLDPAPTRFRLSVAAWNERAIRAYERAGFARGSRFGSATRGGETEFLVMTATPPPRPRGARRRPVCTIDSGGRGGRPPRSTSSHRSADRSTDRPDDPPTRVTMERRS